MGGTILRDSSLHTCIERNEKKDAHKHTDDALKKELGNLIFSSIKFCDELGYNPEECITLAIECQKKFEK